MSEASAQTLAPASQVDKRTQVETLLTELLRRMDYPARLELKELPDASLGVAMFFEGELPGIAPGKRGHLVDCLQFLVNKCINRPGSEKRWVTLGVNGFPEPRQPRPQGQAPATGPATPASPVPSVSAATPAGGSGRAPPPRASTPPGRPAAHGKGQPHDKHADKHDKHPDKHDRHADKHERRDRRDEPDERTLEVAADPLLGAAGKALAEKSAKLGRIYAVLMAKPDDRARLVQAAVDVAGQRVRAEGEGIWRRVTFAPDKPVALPKNTHLMPDYDEEE